MELVLLVKVVGVAEALLQLAAVTVVAAVDIPAECLLDMLTVVAV